MINNIDTVIGLQGNGNKPMFYNIRTSNPSHLTHIQPFIYNFPSVLLSNITGALNNKIPEINELGKQYNTDIFCLIETWCNTDIPDEAISIDNFSLYRRDRQDGRAGGGIMCYIKEDIPDTKVWVELNIQSLETLFITIRPKRLPRGISHITMGIIYHPPKSNDWLMSQHLIDSVDIIRQKYPSTAFMICGDFNHMKDSYFKKSCQLYQLVKYPTHGTSKIDLCYTSLKDFYKDPIHESGIGLSRHQSMVFIPHNKCVNKPEKLTIRTRKITKQNKVDLLSDIKQVNWTDIFKANTCEQKFKLFTDIISNIIENHIPIVETKKNNNDMPWVTDRFRELIKKRQFHFYSGNNALFCFYRNKVNRERKKLKENFVKSTLTTLKSGDAKNWWDLIKTITGKKTKTNHMQRIANTSFNGNMHHLSNEINNFFQRVSAHLKPLDHMEITEFIIPYKYIISVDDVAKQLSKINTKKSVGPDDIPSWILRDACHNLAAPVCSIWNASLSQSYVPAIWKSANTCPLPKVSIPNNIEKDLRPISLTPILSKGLEFNVRNYFMEYFTPHIDNYQYGSQKKCSTVIALAQLIHEWLLASESQAPITRILLLDFKKAFDLVDHNILIDKLSSINVPPFLKKLV